MKKTIFTLLSLALVACQSTRAERGTSSDLKVRTFTANEAGFLVSSHLIEGTRDAVLVDAQFTISQAEKVVEMVKQSRKHLTTVFITHGHPDHYFGLTTIKKAFPDVKILARREVIQDIQSTGPGKLAYWKKMYGADLADTFIVPEPFDGTSLALESEQIDLITLQAGESEHAVAVYLPAIQTLLTGDLTFNQVHLWLAENRPEAWMKSLKEIQSVGLISKVLPGHGLPAGAELLGENARYIETFLDVTRLAKSNTEAVTELKKRFPSYKLPIIAELSVEARRK